MERNPDRTKKSPPRKRKRVVGNRERRRESSTQDKSDSQHCRNQKKESNNGTNSSSTPKHQRASKIKVGNAGSFLLQFLGKHDNEICHSLEDDRNNVDFYGNLETVTNFLNQHALALAASNTSTVDTGAVTAASFYLPTVQEFQSTQLDRQAAGLRTNAAKETSKGITQLVNGHLSALQAAMEHANGNISKSPSNKNGQGESLFGLSKDHLCSFHTMLCPSHAQSGKFRSTQAKAGNTYFCTADKIDSEMDRLFTFMEIAWSKWQTAKKNDANEKNISVSTTYSAVTLVAVFMYAINDIHPFADGNGRMSRICANYVLRRLLGLPFTITLVATDIHRKEYIDALKQGHFASQKKLSSSNNNNGEKSFLSSLFQPAISVILDRLAHAIRQLQQLLAEKARAVSAEEEDRVARRVRERAAAGQCVICLDEKPNIATLCCGQAVHLNCIAEWLANQTTCVSCRAPLPQLLRQQPIAAASNNNETSNNNYDFDTTDNTTTSEGNETEPPQDTTTTEDVTTEARATETRIGEARLCMGLACNNTAAADCLNQLCGSCCDDTMCPRHAAPPPSADTTTTTTTILSEEEDTTTTASVGNANYEDTTTTEEASSTSTTTNSCNYADTTTQNVMSQRPSCSYSVCNNQAASDCDNGMCGRCCVLRGTFQCIRHGG